MAVTEKSPKPKASGKARKSQPSATARRNEPAAAEAAKATKQDRMLTLLSRPDGATIADLAAATDWQRHSVHGFLSGTVKTKLGLELHSTRQDGGERRYRLGKRFEA